MVALLSHCGLLAGLQSFVKRAVDRANLLSEEAAHVGDPYGAGGDMDGAMAALPSSSRREEPPLVIHVDITGVCKLSLDGLPHFARPLADPVDKLATEVARLKKRGHVDPYIFTDLKGWLPHWGAVVKKGVRFDCLFLSWHGLGSGVVCVGGREADPMPAESDIAPLAEAIKTCVAEKGKDENPDAARKYLDMTRCVLVA